MLWVNYGALMVTISEASSPWSSDGAWRSSGEVIGQLWWIMMLFCPLGGALVRKTPRRNTQSMAA